MPARRAGGKSRTGHPAHGRRISASNRHLHAAVEGGKAWETVFDSPHVPFLPLLSTILISSTNHQRATNEQEERRAVRLLRTFTGCATPKRHREYLKSMARFHQVLKSILGKLCNSISTVNQIMLSLGHSNHKHRAAQQDSPDLQSPVYPGELGVMNPEM